MCKQGLSIVALGGLLFLMAEDVLYFLHAETTLVEESATGVTSQVPVQVLGDACLVAYGTKVGIAAAVVANVGQFFQSGIVMQDA